MNNDPSDPIIRRRRIFRMLFLTLALGLALNGVSCLVGQQLTVDQMAAEAMGRVQAVHALRPLFVVLGSPCCGVTLLLGLFIGFFAAFVERR